MPTDKRIDTYIAKSKDFAKPILEHLRGVVHEGCPDVVESIKWGHPAFDYRGPLCGMAAFNAHCRFFLWKGALVFGKSGHAGAGPFGDVHSLAELPSRKLLVGYVRKAASLNEHGVKAAPRERKPVKPVVVPVPLRAALKKNARAQAAFDACSPSHRREYAEWVAEAKTDDTRQRRIDTTIEWLAQGKSRNWKYEKK